MFQAQIRLGSLPVNLVLVGDRTYGEVVFVKVAPVGITMDQVPRDEVSAWFDEDGFTFFDQHAAEDLHYDTLYDYKNIPLMLRWLQQQNLQQPL